MKLNIPTINNSLHIGLLLICAGLVLMLSIELNQNYSFASNNNAPGTIDKQPVITPAVQMTSIKELPDYAEIIQRPLFNEDRKPHVFTAEVDSEKPKVKKKAMAVAPPLQLSLTAIVITPETSIAILQSGNSQTPQQVKTGDTIEGWTLAEVHDQFVIIEQGDNRQTLELEIKNSNHTSKTPASQKTTTKTSQNTIQIKDENTKDTTNNAKSDINNQKTK